MTESELRITLARLEERERHRADQLAQIQRRLSELEGRPVPKGIIIPWQTVWGAVGTIGVATAALIARAAGFDL